jgi:hypothetical protein
MPPPREAGGQHGELALATADGQITNEEKHFHARSSVCSSLGSQVDANIAMRTRRWSNDINAISGARVVPPSEANA